MDDRRRLAHRIDRQIVRRLGRRPEVEQHGVTGFAHLLQHPAHDPPPRHRVGIESQLLAHRPALPLPGNSPTAYPSCSKTNREQGARTAGRGYHSGVRARGDGVGWTRITGCKVSDYDFRQREGRRRTGRSRHVRDVRGDGPVQRCARAGRRAGVPRWRRNEAGAGGVDLGGMRPAGAPTEDNVCSNIDRVIGTAAERGDKHERRIVQEDPPDRRQCEVQVARRDRETKG